MIIGSLKFQEPQSAPILASRPLLAGCKKKAPTGPCGTIESPMVARIPPYGARRLNQVALRGGVDSNELLGFIGDDGKQVSNPNVYTCLKQQGAGLAPMVRLMIEEVLD